MIIELDVSLVSPLAFVPLTIKNNIFLKCEKEQIMKEKKEEVHFLTAIELILKSKLFFLFEKKKNAFETALGDRLLFKNFSLSLCVFFSSFHRYGLI